MRRSFLIICTVLSLAAPAAAELKKYKTWADTPEAYFLTEAEREEWSRIKTDGEAEAFVARYFARRGNDFMEELTLRIQKADQYLSIGKKKGSETARGKLTILFGPPSKLDRQMVPRGSDRSNAITPMANASEGRSPAGISMDSAAQAATSVSNMRGSAATVTLDTMTWSGDRLPKSITEPITVRVEFDSAARERIQGTKEDLAKLDAMIEAVALSSLRPVTESGKQINR